MTGLILSALAVFVAGHGDPGKSYHDIEKPHYIYENYYLGKPCELLGFENVGPYPVRECTRDGSKGRTDDFYIVFDLKNQTWERYRKTQLLWLYIMNNKSF